MLKQMQYFPSSNLIMGMSILKHACPLQTVFLTISSASLYEIQIT